MNYEAYEKSVTASTENEPALMIISTINYRQMYLKQTKWWKHYLRFVKTLPLEWILQ